MAMDERRSEAERQAEVAGAAPMFSDAWLQDVFEYHQVEGDQVARIAAIRGAALELARVICRVCPSSADRSAAVRKVREAVHAANASIALDGRA